MHGGRPQPRGLPNARFAGYHRNQKPMLRVIGKHRKAAKAIPKAGVSNEMRTSVKKVWDECRARPEGGYRNGQVTVLAPTGTIFMMTAHGVEPDIALIKYKKLVGGGMLKIVNQTVPLALDVGYSPTSRPPSRLPGDARDHRGRTVP